MPRTCIGQCCDPNQNIIPGHLIPRHDTLRAEFEAARARDQPVPHHVYAEVNPVLPVPLEATQLTAAASAHWIEYLLTRLTPAGFDLVSDRVRQLILFRVGTPSGLRSNPTHGRHPPADNPEDLLRDEQYRRHVAECIPNDLGPQVPVRTELSSAYRPVRGRRPPAPRIQSEASTRRRCRGETSGRAWREAAQDLLEAELAAADDRPVTPEDPHLEAARARLEAELAAAS